MPTNFQQLFLQESLFHFNESTPRIQQCLDKLAEEQIWQRPNPSSNSIGNLILHLCGNIRQYIISSLGQQPDVRERDSEFAPIAIGEGNEWSRGALFELLVSTTNEAVEVMETCPEEELLRKRLVQGFELSGIGIIIHVVEHYSYHTGQIAFWTKLLLDEDLGFYADIDLGVKNE